MGTWIMKWKNGDVTAVSAPSKMDAIDYLENIGPVDASRLEPFAKGCAVTFRPTKSHGLTFAFVSSGLQNELYAIYANWKAKKKRFG